MNEHNHPQRVPISLGDTNQCHHCDALIPVFTNLSAASESRVRELIREGRDIMAIEELRQATGCGVPDAKVWVAHRGRPWPAAYGQAICPFCGGALRTSLARQCPHCYRDWHDRPDANPPAN